MKYKTTAEIRNEALILTDGKLEELGDFIFSYQALLLLIELHNYKRTLTFMSGIRPLSGLSLPDCFQPGGDP
ncbi:hypothetical protein [Legionella jordanis]|uniref:Uncharacterized protein n=1 Tax=Legionella jordanis TaxID=456 RepID=A0A0W0VBP8_9GAMM|nr:hypothetical protein [Legionella jordanis]KTD17563.1 hypothetical protein Ljor_1869 [Legionella jordanis]RMX05101.1 hypothetical protein EAW55_00080 [Legionella jordanis]RMX17357.1 hypothetical protein EAS68_10710 [Legionella jordanis]VEH13532.1 Uncharacterised protein [Legionella jordanis]HAT8714448.1 hypothetical protein [Legionella jordanis]